MNAEMWSHIEIRLYFSVGSRVIEISMQQLLCRIDICRHLGIPEILFAMRSKYSRKDGCCG